MTPRPIGPLGRTPRPIGPLGRELVAAIAAGHNTVPALATWLGTDKRVLHVALHRLAARGAVRMIVPAAPRRERGNTGGKVPAVWELT